MLELVTGGSGSGKSAYAEGRARSLCGETEPLIYVATMKRGGAETEARILRHRGQREGMGFITAEKPVDLLSLSVPENATVLLECMSNLLANEMFDEGGDYMTRIKDGIEKLICGCKNAVLVSNDICSDGIEYGGETEEYKRALARLNAFCAQRADRITEVAASIPITRGGNMNA